MYNSLFAGQILAKESLYSPCLEIGQLLQRHQCLSMIFDNANVFADLL